MDKKTLVYMLAYTRQLVNHTERDLHGALWEASRSYGLGAYFDAVEYLAIQTKGNTDASILEWQQGKTKDEVTAFIDAAMWTLEGRA